MIWWGTNGSRPICYWADGEVATGVQEGGGKTGVAAGQVGQAGSEITGDLVHGRGISK